jgi:c-di-GMP-binding flagellar brake protein YcgR
MPFTPIKAEELVIGQPIPWTVYDASGEMMLEPGYIPKSAQQITAFINSGVSRDPDEQLGQVDKTAVPNTSQREAGGLTLEQIKLNIGDSIQLQFQSESDNTRCIVTLIGYLADQGVIVSTPMLNGRIMLVREGQIFVVRLFSGKSAYAFTAVTKRVTNNPFPHLHLSYPKEIRGLVVRGSSRARANIICYASLEGGNGYSCVARDISVGGALIAAREKIAEAGQKISLKMRVKVNETEHMLALNCQIRSVNTARTSADETPTILHGLSFENVSSQDSLVISALLYQNMVNEKDAEE